LVILVGCSSAKPEPAALPRRCPEARSHFLPLALLASVKEDTKGQRRERCESPFYRNDTQLDSISESM
jgi:hypothetical protein